LKYADGRRHSIGCADYGNNLTVAGHYVFQRIPEL
jgi:hypothetical protein